MKITIVYDNIKDKELVELVEFPTPYFIEFVDTTTREGLKNSFKVKGKYGARLNPFVVIENDKDEFIKCFWSETGNAVQQFINFIKNENQNKKT